MPGTTRTRAVWSRGSGRGSAAAAVKEVSALQYQIHLAIGLRR